MQTKNQALHSSPSKRQPNQGATTMTTRTYQSKTASSRNRFALLSLVLAALVAGAAPGAWGALTYDGGDGDWSQTDTNWSGGTWTNGNQAILPASAGTLTLTEDIVVGYASQHITVNGSGYVINNVEDSTSTGKTLTFDATGQTGNYTIGLNGPAAMTINAPVVLTGNTIGIRESGAEGTLTINGDISGSAGLNTHWDGGGTSGLYTLVLNGDNTFTGVADDYQFHGGVYHGQGTLVVGSDTALGTGNLYWVSGAKLQAGNGSRTVANTLRLPNAPNVEFTGANDLTFTTDVPCFYSTGAKFTVTDPAATLTFGSLTESVQYTNGGMEKLGAGTLAITGQFGCGGTITVSAGTLLLNGSTGDKTNDTGPVYQGQQDYTVAAGAALGGDGTINLLSTSTLTFTSGADDTGAKFYFDPNNTLTVNGGTVDLGDLSIAEILNLDASTAPGTYTLMDGTANFITTGLVQTDPASSYLVGGYTRAYFDTGSLNLVVFIPEPASFALLGLAGLALMHRRGRRA